MNSRKRSLQTLWDIHTNMYKTDDQQEPAVWHRELYSVFYNSLREKRMLKKIDTYVCIAESLFCKPETNTTLQINYTSIKKNKKKKQVQESRKKKKTVGSLELESLHVAFEMQGMQGVSQSIQSPSSFPVTNTY